MQLNRFFNVILIIILYNVSMKLKKENNYEKNILFRLYYDLWICTCKL